mgnify:CR=1 FL=1
MSEIDFRKASVGDLIEVADWMSSAEEARIWGGDKISFPFEIGQLQKEIAFSDCRSFSLTAETSLAGFGQIATVSPDKAHLARIIINPRHRGRQLGRRLLKEMIKICQNVSFKQISLNVYMENKVAIRLYETLGFQTGQINDAIGSMKMILDLPAEP